MPYLILEIIMAKKIANLVEKMTHLFWVTDKICQKVLLIIHVFYVLIFPGSLYWDLIVLIPLLRAPLI